MSSAIQTYKYRLKDRHAKKALRDLAFRCEPSLGSATLARVAAIDTAKPIDLRPAAARRRLSPATDTVFERLRLKRIVCV